MPLRQPLTTADIYLWTTTVRLLTVMDHVQDSPPSDEPLPQLLLRTEEAALALGVSRTQIYRLIHAQLLESVRIGSSRRIPTDCLNAYVDKLRRERQALVRP